MNSKPAAVREARSGSCDPRASVVISPLRDAAQLQLRESLLGSSSASDVTEKYELGTVLGRGAFATTRLCVEKGSGRQLACKSIHKKRLEGLAKDWTDVRREMQVMYHLAGHPNMVQLVDAYEDNAYVHLVMELCSGGELVERIIQKGSYTERDAASIIRSVLEVVAYTHDMGCMHRDIKPDNLLLAKPSEDSGIKLADWGFSTFIHPGEKARGLCGTCYYIAPEVISGDYDERADVWSCGVVLYVLLAGRPPFCAVKDEDVFKMIMEDGVANMCDEPWPHISDAAKDAVRCMMTWSPSVRPSAREMLDHPWIREDGVAGDNVIQPEVLSRMKSFASMNKFKKHAALVIASHLPEDQIQGLRELFNSMDRDGSGTITVEEMKQALEKRGSKLPAGELEAIMAVADVNGDGELDYHEFLATTLHQSRLQEEANMIMAFKHFDLDGNGCISPDELKAALEAMGEHGLRDDDVIGMVQAADLDGNGEIDYAEFVSMMLSTSSQLTDAPDGRSTLGMVLGVTSSGRVPSKCISVAGKKASSNASGSGSSNGGSSTSSLPVGNYCSGSAGSPVDDTRRGSCDLGDSRPKADATACAVSKNPGANVVSRQPVQQQYLCP